MTVRSKARRQFHLLAGRADSALAARRSIPQLVGLIEVLQPRGDYALAVVDVPLPSLRCVFALRCDADRLAAAVEATQIAYIRSSLGSHFEDAGFVVLEAASAQGALDHLQREQVAAVISDITMPGEMDGIALANWMLQHRPGLPILLISGREKSDDVKSLLGRQVEFFSKPFDYSAIVSCVHNRLAMPSAPNS